jgi:AMP deaminase
MAGRSDMEVFDVADFEIPVKDHQWSFAMNEEGVFEVFAAPASADSAGSDGDQPDARPAAPAQAPVAPAERLARVPSLKEYFSDLDFLLNVCSDGPAKSFAFRRLKYLASKWSLYCLLNEYQELADMKAVPHR